MMIPDGINAESIKYSKNQIAEAPEYYALTTEKIISQGGECATGYPFGEIVTLERTKDRSSAELSVQNFGGKLITKNPIEGYYYYYHQSIDTTTLVPPCALTDLAGQERRLLTDLVNSVEPK